MTLAEREAVLEDLRADFPFWSRSVAKIVDKSAHLIDFELNDAQLEIDAALEAQRKSGKAQRALLLKARQRGGSTYMQGKAMHRVTLNNHHNAVVVAHDKETSRKLFAMGERMYENLPEEPELKPKRASHRRGTFLRLGDEIDGVLLPDSTYLVDTAGEFESGRGSTYRTVHGSEVAFWPNLLSKYVSLMNAVPDDPDSLVVLESTANGANTFKDLWNDAEEGRSDFLAIFWPWWKDAAYTLPFANEAEREHFARDVGTGPYGEDEAALIDPGPWDTTNRVHVPLTLEQLHWRRRTIANKSAGKLDKFRQEYPSTPQEAFISSGRQVFDPALVQVIVDATDILDPRTPTPEHPGPKRGRFDAASTQTNKSMSGTTEIPTAVKWMARENMSVSDDAPWKLWLDAPEIDNGKPTGEFIIASDVSGRVEEYDGDEPAWDTIQIVGHESRLQVAQWRGRADADQLAEQLLLAALFFNRPWIAVESTGGWGNPVVRRLFTDYRYPYVYFRKKEGGAAQTQLDRLGWDTNRQTKPRLDGNLAEAIRDGTHGIRSRDLALELTTYIKDSRGRTRPEKGKFSDLLMAYSIAQMVADIQPLKKGFGGRSTPDSSSGYG